MLFKKAIPSQDGSCRCTQYVADLGHLKVVDEEKHDGTPTEVFRVRHTARASRKMTLFKSAKAIASRFGWPRTAGFIFDLYFCMKSNSFMDYRNSCLKTIYTVRDTHKSYELQLKVPKTLQSTIRFIT